MPVKKPPNLPPSEIVTASVIWLGHGLLAVITTTIFFLDSPDAPGAPQVRPFMTMVLLFCGLFVLGSVLLLCGYEHLLKHMIRCGIVIACVIFFFVVNFIVFHPEAPVFVLGLLSFVAMVHASVIAKAGRFRYRRWQVQWRRWQRLHEEPE